MEGTQMIRLLKQLHLAMQRFGRNQMDHRDLSTAQHVMLEYLLTQKQGPIYSMDLHKCIGISKAAVSATLKGLYAKGYITFQREQSDERKKRIFLTDKALREAEVIEKEMQAGETRLCQGISQENIEVIRQGLYQMIQNMKEGEGMP